MNEPDGSPPALLRLPPDCEPGAIVGALQRDGAVIVERRADPALVADIRAELAPHLAANPSGRDDFTGRRTARIGAIIARSPGSHALALDPLLHDACGEFLVPYADGFRLHLTQAVSIGPDEGAQPLHRDRVVWGRHIPRSIETQFSTIWALTDFTADNGATRVVPGSHRWDEQRKARADEVVLAEMEAGAVLVYTGSVLHGGGPNATPRHREGLLLHNAPNWLRQEENQYLSCPPHIAQHLTPELRALLGYRSHYTMGFFTPPFAPGAGPELVSPEALFRLPGNSWPGLGDNGAAVNGE